jgi:catalase
MEIIHARYGAHDGHRALHAKGVLCTATFTATPEARDLTRAGHMQGDRVPVIVRFSNGGGDPTVPDYAPDVRGLAVSFRLGDGSATDILAQTLPHYPFRDQEGFLRAIDVSKPSLGALLKFPGFAFRYSNAVSKLPEANRIMGRRASFAARMYYPFHAYKWIDAGGGERFVRYRWLPTVDEPDLGKDEVKGRPDYLFEELAERLDRAPVRMDLEVQIAGEDDDPDDPSDEWPEERRRVIVGTLEVTALDPDADDGIVFDPIRVVDGIEPTGDPVLQYRPDVYTLSHARRTAQ